MGRLPRVVIITGNDVLVPQTEAISVSFLYRRYTDLVSVAIRYFQIFKEPGLLSRYSGRLRAERPGFGSRQGQDFFFLLRGVQTGSGAHPASYEWKQERLSSVLKRSERENDHSSLFIDEVKNSPVRLYGVVYNYLGTRTTLHFLQPIFDIGS
jgi:hypothetical protein